MASNTYCQYCHCIPCVCGTGCATCFQSPCVCAVNWPVLVPAPGNAGSINWANVFSHPLSDADVKKIANAVVAALRSEATKDEIEALRKERDATRQELDDLRRCLKTLVEGK